MNTSSSTTTRALVLGGGGAAGNAWLIGLLAGLRAGGLDATTADLVVGTSAGATTAAQIAGATPAVLYSAIIEAVTPSPPPRSRGPVPQGHLERTDAIIARSADAAEMRRRMGAAAIELAVAAGDDAQTRWHDTVAARFSPHEWPERRTILTVVNAETGEQVPLERADGVGLVDAVAASTAGGPAYRIDGTWYIDGGYRANADNADLAGGYQRVLVLSPFGGRSRFPAEWGLHLATQLQTLRDNGSRVETVFPDAASLAAFGSNMMDYSVRPGAAGAGFAQGKAAAADFTSFWTCSQPASGLLTSS